MPPNEAPPLRLDPALRARLTENLARHERRALPPDGRYRRAAVALVVVDADPARPSGAPAFLLTQRALGLRAHRGQWALPGGRLDEGETALEAALRELREELGLALDAAALLGVLDDYPTRSGYAITPFVLWGGAAPALQPDPSEVLSVHRIALDELCRPDSPRFVAIPESPRPVVQLPIGDELIHAPTGAVLLQFRRVAIEGVCERVADYEQPLFAWR